MMTHVKTILLFAISPLFAEGAHASEIEGYWKYSDNMIKEVREETKLNMDGRPDELVDSVTNMAKGAVFHLFFEGENLRLKQFQNSIIKEIPDYTVIVAPWIFERSILKHQRRIKYLNMKN